MREQLVTLSIIDFQSKLKKISSIMESNMEGWKNQIKCLENQKISKDTTLKESKLQNKEPVGIILKN